MKLLFITLIASLLMACNNSSNSTSSAPVSTSVGAFALDLIETKTSDDTDPVEVNSINFKTEDNEDEFIDVEA